MSQNLLRGILDYGDHKPSEESLRLNFITLKASKFEWNHPDERKIFEYTLAYYQENLEPPDVLTIRDFFGRAEDFSVLEKLKDIHAAPIYERTKYRNLLENELEKQNNLKFLALLKDMEGIITKGLVVEKETFKGVEAAQKYFQQRAYNLMPANTNAVTSGEVTQDAQAEIDAYNLAKNNQAKVYGAFTGLESIDSVFHGIKPGELWIHAAEPANLKTAFATNWAYNLITRYRKNVLYISLEMKYAHLRKIMCTMHTSNGIFAKQGYAPLDYRKIRDGELTSEEEAFYRLSLEDLSKNPEYCRMHIWVPDRDITMRDVRVYAEQLHKELELSLVIIDQGELVKPLTKYRDVTSEQNETIREMKLMAMHFNAGEGIPILDLHQINRTGMTANEKLKKTPEALGQYTYRDLSYANQAERSADYITTTYAPKELIEQGYAIVGCMKSRDNQQFNLGRIGVDMSCHRLRNWDLSANFGVDMTQDDYSGV